MSECTVVSRSYLHDDILVKIRNIVKSGDNPPVFMTSIQYRILYAEDEGYQDPAAVNRSLDKALGS